MQLLGVDGRQEKLSSTFHESKKNKDQDNDQGKHSNGGNSVCDLSISGRNAAALCTQSTAALQKDYRAQLHILQVELVRLVNLERHFIGCKDKILVLLDGVDAADMDGNQDGNLKRIVEYLAERKIDPLKQWKRSPVNGVEVAVKHWKAYSKTRDAMLLRTHTAIAPWHIVPADDKRPACQKLIRNILSQLHCAGKQTKLVQPDPAIALAFSLDCIDSRRLAH